MATLYAKNNHNWSARTSNNWTLTAGGTDYQTPTVGDTLDANGKSVTIDTDLHNEGGALIASSGGSWVLGNFNVYSDVGSTASTSGPSSIMSANNSSSASITGNIKSASINLSGNGSVINGISFGGAGTLTINGSITAGNAFTAHAVNVTGNGNLIVGSTSPSTITGATSTNAGAAINKSGSGYLTVTATNIVGGSSSTIILAGTGSASVTCNNISGATTPIIVSSLGGTATSTITVSGSLNGGSASQVIQNNSSTSAMTIATAAIDNTGAASYAVSNVLTATMNIISGSVLSPVNGYTAVNNNSTGTINITANIKGSDVANNVALVGQSAAGTINITGSATGGNQYAAVLNSGVGTVNVTTLAGNTYGPGNVVGKTAQPGIINTAGGTCNVKYLQYGPYGSAPVNGTCTLVADVTNTVQMATGPLTSKILLDGSNTTFQPNVYDVRSTTTFNAGSSQGTMVVPVPGSVAVGVPIDNTVGTAILTAASIFSTDPSTLTTGIGARLKNCATVATVGSQIAALK